MEDCSKNAYFFSSLLYFSRNINGIVQYVVSEKKTCPIILVAQTTHQIPTLMSCNGALSVSLTGAEVTTLF